MNRVLIVYSRSLEANASKDACTPAENILDGPGPLNECK